MALASCFHKRADLHLCQAVSVCGATFKEVVATLLDILEGPRRDVSITVSTLQAMAACAAVQGVVAAAVADAGPRERLLRCLLDCMTSGSWEIADTAWELLRLWLQAHVRSLTYPMPAAGPYLTRVAATHCS